MSLENYKRVLDELTSPRWGAVFQVRAYCADDYFSVAFGDGVDNIFQVSLEILTNTASDTFPEAAHDTWAITEKQILIIIPYNASDLPSLHP